MCKDYLNAQTIQLQKAVANRDEAITLAAEPLVRLGKITDGYVTQMIEAVNEMGPYMVIMPGVALAHGRPSENVKENCMSLLTLSRPVVFGHAKNDPVSIIFVLASGQTSAHLSILKDISKLLGDPEFMGFLHQTDDLSKLITYFS